MRACARSKDVGFSCRTVLRHDKFCANPTGGFGPLLTPHRPKARALRSCLFPAWITHLPTPQGCGQPCGFVSYPRSKLTPSVCKTHSVSHTPVASACGAFFKKTKETGSGIAANPCPRVLSTPFGRGQPTAPLLIGRQVAGARARERTGGAAQGGRGAACPTPGAALGGGGTRGEGRKAAPLPGPPGGA